MCACVCVYVCVFTHTILIALVEPWDHTLLVLNMYYYPKESHTFKSQELCLPVQVVSALVSKTLGTYLMIKYTVFVASQEKKGDESFL